MHITGRRNHVTRLMNLRDTHLCFLYILSYGDQFINLLMPRVPHNQYVQIYDIFLQGLGNNALIHNIFEGAHIYTHTHTLFSNNQLIT